MKKVFICADMEGTTGIASWDETEQGTPLYPHFARQMSLEVAAACEGALEAGADEVFVKDAHDSGRNIDPSLLPEGVRIFRDWGRHPFSMMAGLDASFDGVLFTGTHSAAGMNTNPLAHTMNKGNNYVKINGVLCPEARMNAMTAAYMGVPVRFVAGDKGVCDFMQKVNPRIEAVPVSEGMGSGSVSIHPALACRLIRETAKRAVEKPRDGLDFPLPKHFNVEICFKNHDRATGASFYPGCEQIDVTNVRFETDDYFEVLRFIYWVL